MDTAFPFDFDDHDITPSSNRSERFRTAFEASKLSYPTEHVPLEPGWYRTCSEESVGPRKLEWTVQSMYLRREYKSALTLAIQALPQPGTLQLHSNGKAKELTDIAARSALHLGDLDTALELAASIMTHWGSSCGETAGKVFMAAGRPKDAVVSFLVVMGHHRVQAVPLLVSLSGSFSLWREQVSRETKEDNDRLREALTRTAEWVSAALDKTCRQNAFPDRLLLANEDGHKGNHERRDGTCPFASSEEITAWVDELGLPYAEKVVLIGLCEYAMKTVEAIIDPLEESKGVRAL